VTKNTNVVHNLLHMLLSLKKNKTCFLLFNFSLNNVENCLVFSIVYVVP